MATLPRISLITPSFQQAPYLSECLRSVADQHYPDLEHIVIDGGSTDGSKEIIERHAGQLSAWMSEPDRGQSHAINKGLARAHGTVFGWLNSDDALLPNALQQVGETFAADPELLVLGGRLLLREDDGDRPSGRLNGTDPDRLFIEPVINQPATFIRLDAVQAIGGVEERLRYVMDLELWWQLLFRHGTEHLRFIPVDLALFRLHGESKTGSQIHGFIAETASLLHGLCLRSGNEDLAQVLSIGHTLTTGLREIPVSTVHHDLVRSMTVHFLLKWNDTIHHAGQFHMMRAFRRTSLQGVRYLAGMQDRLQRLDEQLRPTSWTMFRVRRKWAHWWS